MSLWTTIAGQFGKPAGMPGRLAGMIMANRASNVERNRWAVSLLELKPADRVLETGFGPGVAVQQMAETVTDGIVFGIDFSAVMLEQASRRNRSAISRDRVRLQLASASDPPGFDSPLDKILDINSFQFWENPVRNLEKLRPLLRDGGRMVLVHQPRKPGSTEQDVDAAGVQLARCMEEAGFRDIATRKRAMQPVAAIAVIGTK